MEQKRVSFKVAKAIKEVGYPLIRFQTESYEQFNEGFGYKRSEDDLYLAFPSSKDNAVDVYFAPTYLDVWLWLWREKRIDISCSFFAPMLEWHYVIDDCIRSKTKFNDPEEAIIAAIDYLVDNNLFI